MSHSPHRRPPRLRPLRRIVLFAAIPIAALACSIAGFFPTASSQSLVDLSAASEIYNAAGISLDEALAAKTEDRRPEVLALMGAPDAFTLEWQMLNDQLVRWEEWSYFDFGSRFDFVDGELLWTIDIDPAADGSIYAHTFDPMIFQPGMSPVDVKAAFPDLPFMEIPLEEADIPTGMLLVTDQFMAGFGDGRLVYVQTFIMSPTEPLVYAADLAGIPWADGGDMR
jgi:hypothetical protein